MYIAVINTGIHLTEEDMKRFIYLYFILFIASFGLCSNAISQTTTVTIDPGVAGTTFYKKSFPFDDLNGIAAGRLSPLEFALSDSKFITVQTNDDWLFQVTLTITYSNSLVTGFVPVASAYLTDGVDTLTSEGNGTAGGGNIDTYNLKWIDWNNYDIDGFTFTSIILPYVQSRAYPDNTVIESAVLEIQVWGDSKTGTLEIGPVPEPTGSFIIIPLRDGGVVAIDL